MDMERKTKIICTIGPASESKEMMRKLVDTGMNIIRLNFSHGDYEEHGRRIKTIREIVKETGKSIAILLDTKGPEVRLGDFENKTESYEKGEIVTIVREKVLGTHECFHIQCPEVFNDVEVGGTILIDDGKMRLTIIEKDRRRAEMPRGKPAYLEEPQGVQRAGRQAERCRSSPRRTRRISVSAADQGIDYHRRLLYQTRRRGRAGHPPASSSKKVVSR